MGAAVAHFFQHAEQFRGAEQASLFSLFGRFRLLPDERIVPVGNDAAGDFAPVHAFGNRQVGNKNIAEQGDVEIVLPDIEQQFVKFPRVIADLSYGIFSAGRDLAVQFVILQDLFGLPQLEGGDGDPHEKGGWFERIFLVSSSCGLQTCRLFIREMRCRAWTLPRSNTGLGVPWNPFFG